MSQFTQEQLDAVFHAYDIRGQYPDNLNDEFYEYLAKAYITYLKAKKIAVGYDIRPESVQFAEAFIKGAVSMNCDIVKVGEIATEMMYFKVGSDSSLDGGAVITASHNPAGWNGCKLVGKSASPLSSDKGLKEVKEIMLIGSYSNDGGQGSISEEDIYPEFKQKILSFLDETEIKPMKVVIDAGNGVGGKIYDYVFGDLPLEITRMYFEPDGTFPNHTPDPIKEENVKDIKAKIKELNPDLGIAIDGDADRVFFLDKTGRRPSGIYMGSIFTKYFLNIEPKFKIIQDPRITWPIKKEVEKLGGESVVVKAGHSFFKKYMKEMDAVFAAEYSSHFYYKDFYFADSGMVTIALMLKMLSEGMDLVKELDYLYTTYPNSGEVNYKVNVAETIKKVEEVFVGGKVEHIDGLSIEYPEWRFNLRGSNTQPLIRLNVEANDKNILIEKFHDLERVIAAERDNIPELEELRME